MKNNNYIRLAVATSLLLAAGCSSGDPREWEKNEKGAAIGGLGGAALGGIIGNQTGNAGTGALLGGAAGAGAGYLIGKEEDQDDRGNRQRHRDHDRD